MKSLRKSLSVCGASLALVAAGSTSALAAAAGDPDTIKARSHFFGFENVDQKTGEVAPDKLIISWFSVQSFAVAVRGRVFFLDSYIYRLADRPAYVPTTVPELVALQPEAIFIGHGHGDHADNAAYIAKWTNATIYASPETCDVMQLDVARMAADPNPQNGGTPYLPDANPVKCVGVVPRGSRPGHYNEGPNAGPNKSSATKLATPLDPLVCVLAFKFIHSGTAPVDPSFPHTPLFDLGDPRYPGREIQTPPPAITYPAMYPTSRRSRRRQAARLPDSSTRRPVASAARLARSRSSTSSGCAARPTRTSQVRSATASIP